MTELLLSLSLLAAVQSHEPMHADTLADLKWKYRLLVVLHDAPEEPEVQRQVAEWQNEEAGVVERDLVLVRAQRGGPGLIGSAPLTVQQAQHLFERFGDVDEKISVVLVGKDGTEKRRWTAPVPLSEIFEIIDAMPMRRREMRERAGGDSGP